jgi:hypothetical protein
MIFEKVEKVGKECGELSTYYKSIGFENLSKKFDNMASLCKEMLMFKPNIEKINSATYSESDVDEAVVKTVLNVKKELLENLDDFYNSNEDTHMETVELIDSAINKSLGSSRIELLKKYEEDS